MFGEDIAHDVLAIVRETANLELIQILCIAHYYVVNSGITKYFDYSNITLNMIFMQLWVLAYF